MEPATRTRQSPKQARQGSRSIEFQQRKGIQMASNRGVAYIGTGKVEVRSIDYPKLALGDRKCEHGVILKVVATKSAAATSTWFAAAQLRPPV